MVNSFAKRDRAEAHFFRCEKLDRAVVAAAVLIVDRLVSLEIKKISRERERLRGEARLISSGRGESQLALGRARESRGERGGEGGGERRERGAVGMKSIFLRPKGSF